MSAPSEIVETSIRCPKCRSRSLVLVETGTWTSDFRVIDGKFDRKGGNHEPESVDRLEGRCGCGHHWKIRGASQIDDAVAVASQERNTS